jgi:hypothetical protein
MKADWRRVFLYLAAAVMEGCWLYVMLSVFNACLAAGRLAVPPLLLLFPAGFGFRYLLLRLKCPSFLCKIAGWVLWAVALLLAVKLQLYGGTAWSEGGWLLAIPRAVAAIFQSFRPELLILLGGTVIWWLGWRLAVVKAGFRGLVGEFQFGLVLLLGGFFSASQFAVPVPGALPVVLVFFAVALSGMPVAHSLEGDGWLSGLYRGHWAGLLLMGIGLVILLGLLISWVVTPDFLQVILNALKWVWGIIASVIMFIISLLPKPDPSEIAGELPSAGMGPSENATVAERFSMPEWLRSGLRTGWSLMLIGVVILALWRLSSDVFGWMRRRLAGLAGAEMESVPHGLGADIRSFFQRIWKWLRRVCGVFRFRRKSATMLPEVAPVRQLYRQFLRWAEKAGCGRDAGQTPYEYLYAVAERLPEAREDIARLTQRYVAVRYGTALPGEDEIESLRQSWRRVRKYNLKKTHGE